MNDIQSQLHEGVRKRDETVHALDVVQREREHAADNERLKMQGKIAEIAEEVSRKILTKEIRLREEAQQKFGNIEKVRIKAGKKGNIFLEYGQKGVNFFTNFQNYL